MDSVQLSQQNDNKVNFIGFIIPQFAEYCKMSIVDAYLYLKKYGGLRFLDECWWALHTDSDFYAVHSIYSVCRNNGGQR